jgi:hypothetical protein
MMFILATFIASKTIFWGLYNIPNAYPTMFPNVPCFKTIYIL